MQLVVSNLPLPCSAAEVQQLFEAYGTVVDTYISPVVASFAFVEMRHQAEADEAWQGLHRSTYRGNLLTVVPPRPNPPGPALLLSDTPDLPPTISISLEAIPPIAVAEPVPLSNTEENAESQIQGMVLVISNLPLTFKKSDLRKMFKEYGDVESINDFKTVEDQAIVEMSCKEEALVAIKEIDGSTYDGNILSVTATR